MLRSTIATALVACAALSCAPTPAEAGLHTFTVDMLHRAVETHDATMAAEAYADSDDTVLMVNGQTYRGRNSIELYYRHLASTLLLQRFSVTSPVYEAGDRTHFSRLAFMVGEAGCLASVRSFEQVTFSTEGHVVRHVSEWLESPAAIQADLECKHGEHDGEHGHMEASQAAMETVYNFHHAVESAAPEDFARLWAPEAVMVLDGDEASTLVGPEVLAWWEPIFERIKTAVYTPTSTVQSRTTRSVTASALFFMSNTGCSGTVETIAYFTHDASGRITRLDLFAAGTSMAAARRNMLEDCGFGHAHDEL